MGVWVVEYAQWMSPTLLAAARLTTLTGVKSSFLPDLRARILDELLPFEAKVTTVADVVAHP